MAPQPDFLPGIELGRRFYSEAVRPILDARFPGLPHDAALLGSGSDRLGFDTEMSRDHDWGPSVCLFIREADIHLRPEIDRTLGLELPPTFYGYSTHFAETPLEAGTQVMSAPGAGPINHRVTINTVRAFVRAELGYDLDPSKPPAPADWLAFPSQRLRGLTSGAVYHEGLGEVGRMREQLAWYPHDVWLLLMAAGWKRISQEEHLMPRVGYVGDELGSAIIGSRLVRDLMSLCFLIERQYAPYPKWFGTAFKQLACAHELSPVLWRAQIAPGWQEREQALVEAYSCVARAHNGLGITEHLPEEPSYFFNRPFRVIWGERFTAALLARITDPEVVRIASLGLIGGIDQFSDSTDLRSDPAWFARVRYLYDP